MKQNHCWMIEMLGVDNYLNNYRKSWRFYILGGKTRKQGRVELKKWNDTYGKPTMFRLVKYIAAYDEIGMFQE